MVRPTGILIDLLQEEDLRVNGSDVRQDLGHVQLYPLFVRGLHGLAAIHKEVGVVAQSTVTDVPGHDGKGFPCRKRTAGAAFHGDLLRIRRLVLRNGQKADEQRETNDYD